MQMFELHNLIIILGMESKRHFVEASDRQIEKLVENSVPRNTEKKNPKMRRIDLSVFVLRNQSEGYQINPFLACWYIWGIMPLAERLSSEFHCCLSNLCFLANYKFF